MARKWTATKPAARGAFKRVGSDHDGNAEPGQQARQTTRALTREAWLHRAIEAFRPRFAEIGLPLPGKLHVSVGFGYSSRAESKYILGQCWARRASADGVNHIFLGPQEGDPAAMLVSLLHELIHAADDCASGHKGAFAEAATRLGFDGPMTQTPPGIELAAEVITLAEALGPFPHARLDPAAADVPAPVPPGGTPAPGPGRQGPQRPRQAGHPHDQADRRHAAATPSAPPANGSTRATRCARTASPCTRNDPPGHRPGTV